MPSDTNNQDLIWFHEKVHNMNVETYWRQSKNI